MSDIKMSMLELRIPIAVVDMTAEEAVRKIEEILRESVGSGFVSRYDRITQAINNQICASEDISIRVGDYELINIDAFATDGAETEILTAPIATRRI